MINKENYSVYIIDYFDGKLSEKEVQMLFYFLDQHSDLKSELEGLTDFILQPETTIFYPDKQSIKKNISPYQKISAENYEAFFLDFHEGNLTNLEQQNVLTFVQLNPILQKEFNSFQAVLLKSTEQVKVLDKEKLEKDELKNNPVLQSIIAMVEGDLDKLDSLQIRQQIQQNAELAKEYERVKKSFLKADYSITYKGKSSLKHYPISSLLKTTTVYYWSVAASILLLIGISAYFYFAQENTLNQSPLATHSTKKEVKNDSTITDENKNSIEVENKFVEEKKKILTKQKNKQVKKPLLAVEQEEMAQQDVKPLVDTVSQQGVIQLSEQQLASEILTFQLPKHREELENKISEQPAASPSTYTYLTLASLTEKVIDRNIKDEAIKEELRQLPKSNRKIDQIASLGLKALEKITAGKIKYENCYGENGEMLAYHVSVGSFQLAKNSCK